MPKTNMTGKYINGNTLIAVKDIMASLSLLKALSSFIGNFSHSPPPLLFLFFHGNLCEQCYLLFEFLSFWDGYLCYCTLAGQNLSNRYPIAPQFLFQNVDQEIANLNVKINTSRLELLKEESET